MSFSGKIKEELLHVVSGARHCQLAELAALFQFCGRVKQTENGSQILQFQTENKIVAKKAFTLLKKTFRIDADVTTRCNNVQLGGMTYLLTLENPVIAHKILESLKAAEVKGARLQNSQEQPCSHRELGTDTLLIKNSCCKRAFLRGAYLAAGSMSDPYKGYHLELVSSSQQQAEQILKLLHDFELDAKMVLRKRYYVVYIKEGENIADFLNIIEAHQALMEFENTRIYKGMRNMVNRKVNCEAANISKTVNAAARQVEDIRYIEQVYGLEKLPENLKQMAYVRLENPEAALGELGKLLEPPVGKSGVNHRLRKIGEFAQRLRGQ